MKKKEKGEENVNRRNQESNLKEENDLETRFSLVGMNKKWNKEG